VTSMFKIVNSKTKFEVRRLGTIGSLAVVILAFSGCASNQVTLTKQPITIEKVFIDDVKDKSEIPVTEDEEAATTWNFGCKTDFDFDIVDKTPLQNHDFMVSLKITKVHLTLSAPIEIWISKTASPTVLHHEQAHVKICERVYKDIDESALSAGRVVIGREYQASAGTTEDACRLAIERAGEDVYQRYHSAATDTIRRVSTIFDQLEVPTKGAKKETIQDIDAHLEEAFSKFKTNVGVKQKT